MDLGLLCLAAAVLAGLSLNLAGCEDERECVNCVDQTPPAVPTNVFSVTGNGYVDVFWSYLEYPQPEDLVYYWIWRREIDRDEDDLDSDLPDPDQAETIDFSFLAEVPVDDPIDAFFYGYRDNEVVNGQNYEYAVSSVDAAGNESELSLEVVLDTPRPSGFGLELHDNVTVPSLSGYDFSSSERLEPTPTSAADIRIVFEGGIPFVEAVRTTVRLQDYGNIPLADVDWAPAAGWSATGKVELIELHSYIVEIQGPSSTLNYAKFEVINVLSSSVIVDWAYQPINGLPELKAPGEPKPPVVKPELIKF